MTCEELDARLDDWLDGALAPSEAAAVGAHLAGCESCRAAERGLRQVVAHAAALPRSVSPPRDLWPEIARRIEAGAGWRGLFGWGPSLALAAAATVLLAVAGVLWHAQAPATVHTVEIPATGAAFTAVATSAATVPDPVLAQAEREYEAAANTLLEALQRRGASLPPGDLERVRANLQVIDRALAEVRQALASDPANPELNRMLVATHRKKVDVLRRVVRLSTQL
jgi:anti-sigma factor RsiW